MPLAYVAELALPAMVPSVMLSIGAPAIAINASLEGALSLEASLTISPPTMAVYLAALVEVEAQIAAAIELGLPSVSFDVSAAASLVASLEAAFGLLVTLEALLEAAVGVYAFAYTGPGDLFGAAVTSELASTWPDGAPSSGAANAMVFGAVSTAAQDQLQAFLNGLTVGSGLVYTAKLSALAALSLVTGAAVGQGEPAIQLQLDAALKVQVAASVTPPTLAVTLEALASFEAYLRTQIAFGPPSVQAAISASADLAASLTAQFSLLIELGALLTSPGLFFCYTYAGAGDALGPALTTALATTWGDGSTPTSGACLAVLLGTIDSASWTTLTGFFGGL